MAKCLEIVYPGLRPYIPGKNELIVWYQDVFARPVISLT